MQVGKSKRFHDRVVHEMRNTTVAIKKGLEQTHEYLKEAQKHMLDKLAGFQSFDDKLRQK